MIYNNVWVTESVNMLWNITPINWLIDYIIKIILTIVLVSLQICVGISKH